MATRSERILLSEIGGSRRQCLEVFALLNLGLAESLALRRLKPVQALQRFYHVENCDYVRRSLRSREANEIMSRGVQLADLADMLAPAAARRELARELLAIRGASLKLLERHSGGRQTEKAAA